MMTADGDVPAELSKLEKGYELLGELSRDEMLTVYVARDRLSGNEVAIKVLRARNGRDREALAHYASDARLLTALEHPNIVAVHSVKWLTEDVVAVVTERVRGPSLRQVLDVAGTLPVARATDVLRGLGRALAWAHSSQIMHRDVRPETVIFEDRTGRVVLSDFGLARRLEATPGAGDPAADAYRAPELSDGRYPDRRSDVYSLGIVGWELLTGRRPWPDTMDPVEPGDRAPAPPPLAEVRPGLPPALVAALEGAVELDRDRRIADVVTFMERLTKVAPPAPKSEEEPAADTPVAFEPTEWVALPVPRMPQRATRTSGEREVPREASREADGDAAPSTAAPFESAALAEPTAPVAPKAPIDAKRDAAVEREAGREVRRDVRPAPPESFAPPAARASTPMAHASPEAATAPPAPATPAVPRRAEAGAERPRAQKGEPPSDATAAATAQRATPIRRPESAAAEPKPSADQALPAPPPAGAPQATVAPMVSADRPTLPRPTGTVPPGRRSRSESPAFGSAVTEHGRPEEARAEPRRPEPARAEPAHAEPARPEPARAATAGSQPVAAESDRGERARSEAARAEPGRAEPDRPRTVRADVPLTGATALGAAAAASIGAESAGAEAPVPKGPVAAPRAAKASSRILSDVELPPPEPVRLADMTPEPLRGPISGPVRAQPRGGPRVEAMRGGLGTPRAPNERARRDASSGPLAPPPLQPMWDTPVEFPLPVMPDPRPLPADVAGGADGAARRRWTRRGVGITAAVALLIAAAFALARMERAPDTTAELIKPENPTGYGGDVVLPPRAGDSTALRVPGAGTAPAGTRTDAGGAGRARGGAAPSAREPAAAPPVPPTASRPGGSSSSARSPAPRPAAAAAAAPATRGATNTARPTERAPARANTGPTVPAGRATTGSTPGVTRTAEARPVTPAAGGPCNSPALSDQRTCLAAAIDRSDAGLNKIYGDVVAAMRQRASTAQGDPDPPEVQRLRAVQRAWLVRRDAECRRRGRGREGPLWATPRASCLEEFSAERSRELSATLARLRRD